MNKINEHLVLLWKEKPLRFLLVLALCLRLISVIFSQGYGWHDDHFLTIEPPHSWVHGYDYNNWLPSGNAGAFKPSGHSFTYTGIMYGIFWVLEHSGITDPYWQMLLIRFLHAVFSLLIVYYGFKITEKLYSLATARMVGLFLAALYFMPFLSVRNLVEFVCIPFLMGGCWMLIKDDKNLRAYLISGLLFGMAMSVRYQNVLFVAGLGIVLLFTRPFILTFAWGLSVAALMAFTQGFVDYCIWGVPFAEFWEYFTYNQTAGATDYFVREWYMYLVLLIGMFIPPVSLFLITGFASNIRKYALITVPVLFFLAFHSWFPNKQERFILPIIPFLLIIGYGGWKNLLEQNSWQQIKWIRYSWIFFWVLNFIALVPLTIMYSKKSRVECMSWLGKQNDYVSYIIEDSNNSKITMLPDFYSGKNYSSWRIMSDIPAEWVRGQMDYIPQKQRPNYMLFMYVEDLDKRISEASKYFPLERKTTLYPSFMDELLHWLNPNNRNESITVCRIDWEKKAP